MGKATVLTTVYNCAIFLSHTIESVLNQDYEDVELVLVNDNSKDQSVDIINEYFKKSDKIKFVNLPENKGVGNAAASGMEVAEGEFIFMVDGDDQIRPDAISLMIKNYEDYDFMWSQFEHYNGLETWLGHSAEFKEGKTLLDEWPIGHLKSFRRSAYDKTSGFDRTLRSSIDLDIFLKLEEVGKGKFFNEVLYRYIVRNGSITWSPNSKQKMNAQLVRDRAARRRRMSNWQPK